MPVMQFRVKDINVEDNSRVPDFLRTFPKVDLSEVVAEREWVFDHDMGLWTVNGQFMDPTVTSAFPKQGTAEIWRYRNAGATWAQDRKGVVSGKMVQVRGCIGGGRIIKKKNTKL